MRNARHQSRGFTLIASLLLLLLLSGIAIGLMMMVNTEARVGGTDLQNNAAYHSAEGGIEKMSADLAATFQNAQSPTASEICSLGALQPTLSGVTWKDYSVTPVSGCSAPLQAKFGQITAGPNQGLWAQIIPITMLATAAEPGGQEVSMTRQAQVALIPVFQFGIFSDGDLSFFSGPNFDFAGRVHTNGDLYPEVGPGSTLTFHDRLTAYGNVVRAVLPNGNSTSANYNGTVLIPTASQGCDGTKPSCRALGLTEGSVTGAGGNPPQSPQNGNWHNISLSIYNAEIIDGDYGDSTYGTGAKKLSLPFVSGTAFPYEIIRRPRPGESPTSALGQSREYNMAQIRVLLSDDPADLPGGAGDVNNVRLANVTGSSPSNPYGIATSLPTGLPAPSGGGAYTTYFAAASNALPDTTVCNNTNCPTASSKSTLASDWTFAPATPATQTLIPLGAPLVSGAASNAPPTIWLCPPSTVSAANTPPGCPAGYPYYPVTAPTSTWNLIDGYLRVEYRDVSGNWHPVTNEWLQLGFARGLTPPTAPGTNPVNPNAILLLQEPADRSGNGAIDQNGIAPTCLTFSSKGVCLTWKNPLPPEVVVDPTSTSPFFGVTNSSTSTQSISMYNWYPINFYDVREGEARDVTQAAGSCSVNGVMNAVEIDVGNLKRWLTGAIGSSGTSVDYLAQNGYVLYFSDRRGMLPNPNSGNVKSGDSGLEDVINSSSSTGVPNGALEPIPAGQSTSPEDVNLNGVLDNFGAGNMGLAFYNGTVNLNSQIVAAAPDNPYLRINSCAATARKNWVSGSRHALKLVDASLGNVPLRTDTSPASGGFTVASENPVYIQGDYNSNSSDPVWSGGADAAGHAATSVIADAVTFLSNSWVDLDSMTGTPTSMTNRVASNTWYRLAIAGGKNANFPRPSWGAQDFGTDGGTHNFLRYLENWGGRTLTYKGSLVSLYYSTYDTGVYKCCTVVYSPPTRNYSFDSDFATPSGLPPGTPLFRDVDSLGYRQLFTTRTY